jgi:hypothetical protein
VASYIFDFTGKLANSGYADVTIYTGGIRFAGSPSTLRLLQWDGEHYTDITTKVDPRRHLITGRATRLTTFVVQTRDQNRQLRRMASE